MCPTATKESLYKLQQSLYYESVSKQNVFVKTKNLRVAYSIEKINTI